MSPSYDPENSPNTSEKKPPSGSLFSKIRDIFFSIGTNIVQQAKEKERSFRPLERPKVPVTKEQEALLQEEIGQLENIRQQFLKSEGERATPFVKRFVDPFLDHLKDVRSFITKKKEVEKPVLLAEDVLAQIMSIKGRMILKKLQQDLIEYVQKTIYEDLSYIATCQDLLLERGKGPNSEIEKVASLLLDLSTSIPQGEDLVALYQWKQSVDLFRQALVDMASAIVDRELGEVIEESEREIAEIAATLRSLLPIETSVVSFTAGEGNLSEPRILSSIRNSIELFLSRFVR